ncbi:MAG: TadE/TadG family type IV pilus assembly protein [Pseudomonadota bacterium]
MRDARFSDPSDSRCDLSHRQPDTSIFLRFAADQRGGVLVLFTMLMIPMLLLVGFAMELALTEFNRTRLQTTSDSASLAAADLQQSLDSRAVVEDFFEKAGLEDNLNDVRIVDDDTGRTVTVDAGLDQQALLARLAGIETWGVSVVGAAKESRGDIEIAVALDNSGSMSWAPGSTSGPAADPSRMDLLIPAAEAFVDAVQPLPGERGSTTISLVPFATQVSLGPDMLSSFNVTSEHEVSDCVTFGATAEFESTEISTTELLQRTAHHDPVSEAWEGWSLDPDYTVCPTDADRDILAWSENPDALKSKIRAMEPYGYTSIEIATKWAAALLDPSLRSVLTDLAALDGYDYLDDAVTRGTPLAYDASTVSKYLVIMSDGENTRDWDIREPYRSGLSPVYRLNGNNSYAYYRNRRWTNRDYYRVSIDRWRSTPGSGATRLTWQEVWADMSVQKFIGDILSEADSSQTEDQFFDAFVREAGSTWKNDRTEDICQAARDAGIIIFTVGMDTYGQGDTTLSNCASSTSNFYDVQGLDIAAAFESIARQINQLRLTQ